MSQIDDWLKVGGSFDWLTPAYDLAQGFNKIEYEGGDSDCKKIEKQLKQQGIKCRTQFTGDGWRVISKR